MGNWADEKYFNFLPIPTEWNERRSPWEKKRLFEKEIRSLEKELLKLYEQEYIYELIDMTNLYEVEMSEIQNELTALFRKIHSLYFLYCNRLYGDGELVKSVLNHKYKRMESIPVECLHYSTQLNAEFEKLRGLSRMLFESR